MKRIIALSILLFFVLYLNINVSAATWKYEWTNTIVTIPVGDEIEKYKSIPKAYLYKDGAVLPEANITYSTEGDWLYFMKDVNTQKVGEYKVWYKAYENDTYCPGTCTGYKSLVTFKVVDTIAPTIEIVQEEISIRRTTTKLSNEVIEEEENDSIIEEENTLQNKLIANVKAIDNYSDCKIDFIHNIDTTIVGKYKVDVTVTDSSNNYTKGYFYVNIFEDRKPTITFNGTANTIMVSLGDKIDISSYFSAYDSIDGDISNKIIYPVLKTNELGLFSYMVSVTNTAGSKVEYEINIEVVDESAPELVLSTHTVVLNYTENFEEFDFTKYIKSIKDNLEINYDNLSITHDLENKVGSYHIWYSYTDGIYLAEDIIDVKLTSNIKPKIEVSDIVVDINSNVDLMDYVLITDESDPNIIENVVIDDTEVNYDEDGTYYAEVYVVNSSGLSNTKRIKIVVEDNAVISSNNAPFIIVIAILLVVTIGYCGFFLYYFVIRKKHKNI